MSWPESRRAFATREWANRNADIAGLWRSLMQWENYTYDTDLAITPGDGKIFAVNFWPGNSSYDKYLPEVFAWLGAFQFTPQYKASDYFTTRKVAQFFVPPSRILHSGKLRVWAYVVLSDATPVGRIDVTNERTGVITSTAASSAALGGGGATTGWLSLDVSAQPNDSLSVAVVRTSGSGKTIEARDVSAYWVAPALAGYDYATAFAAITRNHYGTAYRPDSAYVARWLGLAANRFMGHRSRPQVYAAHLAGWSSGTMAYLGNSTPTLYTWPELGRYRVVIGAGVSKIRFALLARSSNGAAGNYVTADIQVGGSSIASTTDSPTNAWSWREFSLTITPAVTAREAEIILTPTYAASQYTMVGSVCIWEEEATVTLVGAEALPAGFVANADEAVGGGNAMTAAQRATLVDNMFWLWKYRGLRSLVSDSRYCVEMFRGPAPGAPGVYQFNGDNDQHSEYRFRFLGANKVPRFVVTTHPWFIAGSSWDATDYVWADEQSQKAMLATRTRNTAYTALPSGLEDHVQFTRTSNFAALSAGTVNVAQWGTAVGTPGQQVIRASGLIIEEAPLHEAAGTRS